MNIVSYPHPALLMKSVEVKPSKQIDDLIVQMFTEMYRSKGIGLAANQLGYPWQVIIMNPTGDATQTNKELVFLNPKIVKYSTRTAEGVEGCLSLPTLYRKVTRPRSIQFEALLPNGKPIKGEYSGNVGRCMQHECDHLQGVLFIDHLDEQNRHGVSEYLNKLMEQSSVELREQQNKDLQTLLRETHGS